MITQIEALKQMRAELLERVDALDFAIRTLEGKYGSHNTVSVPEKKNVKFKPEFEQCSHPNLPTVKVGGGIRCE